MKSFEVRFSPRICITFVYKTKFIISQNGKQLAVLDGSFYRVGSITKNGTSWRCIEAHCKGRNNIIENIAILKKKHCQAPKPDALNAREFIEKIKDPAQSSHDKPESLRRELPNDFPVESALELHVAESTRKMVNIF